jgi:molecular chaperone GrpE
MSKKERGKIFEAQEAEDKEKEAAASAAEYEEPGQVDTAAKGEEGRLTGWEREKEALVREKEELIDLLQRERAGFDNYRRISRAGQEEAREYGLHDFLSRLLPVLDNLERALQSARGEEVPATYVEGLEIINRQLLQLLEQEGASPMETLGQVFDPHYHHAVMQTSEGEAEPGTIVEELQKGYLYKKKVLRPALVKVFQD